MNRRPDPSSGSPHSGQGRHGDLREHGIGKASVEPGVCALCRRRGARRLFPVNGTEFSVVECQDCGLAYLNPRVRPADLETLYPPTYYGSGGQRFKCGLEGLVAFFRWRRARRVERIAARGRLLDVGCGRGLFLSCVQKRGWEVSGTEISEAAAQQARDRLRLPVFVGPLTDLGIPDGTYDLVTMWHVLEHLADPVDQLLEVQRVLRDEGWLVLALPNIESWQARLTRGRWYHLDPPRHYYFYTPRTLERLLHCTGFRLIKVRHFSIEHNLHALFHSLFNCLGFPRNFTYEALRTGKAKRIPRTDGPRWLPTLLILLLGLPVALLTVAVCGLEALCRRGGTIEVYARKISQAGRGGPAPEVQPCEMSSR